MTLCALYIQSKQNLKLKRGAKYYNESNEAYHDEVHLKERYEQQQQQQQQQNPNKKQ